MPNGGTFEEHLDVSRARFREHFQAFERFLRERVGADPDMSFRERIALVSAKDPKRHELDLEKFAAVADDIARERDAERIGRSQLAGTIVPLETIQALEELRTKLTGWRRHR